MTDNERLYAALYQLPDREHGWWIGTLSDLEDLTAHDPKAGLQISRKLVEHQAYQHRKRSSDRRTQRERRVLIGATVPLDLADKIRTAAARRGISVYRWCVKAFKAYLVG